LVHQNYGQGFYNIAHMTNNVFAIDWGIKEGANGIEVDLQFKADGTPYAFFHSSVCDCTCMCDAGGCAGLYPNSVCVQLEKSSTKPCNANTEKSKLLNYIVYKRRSLALLMIDSKLTDDGKKMSDATQRKAAENVANMLEKDVFLKGFMGEVVVGAPGFHSYPYIDHLARVVSQKPSIKDRVHFTIDMEEAIHTKKWLDFPHNKNIVYNIGISTCSPSNVASFTVSKLAAINKAKGYFGMTYTWTVDKEVTLEYYTRYFNGIITNYPGSLAKIVKEQGIRLATVNDKIPQAIAGIVETDATKYFCECTYFKGGCKVTKPAPKNLACRCKYSFLWTCTQATIVLCPDVDHAKCKNPDMSKEACLLGRGDCGGYK